jgi:hypothetical protein
VGAPPRADAEEVAALRASLQQARKEIGRLDGELHGGGCTSSRMQPTHNSRAPGYNPWKLYTVVSWFLKRPVTTLGSCIIKRCPGFSSLCFHVQLVLLHPGARAEAEEARHEATRFAMQAVKAAQSPAKAAHPPSTSASTSDAREAAAMAEELETARRRGCTS